MLCFFHDPLCVCRGDCEGRKFCHIFFQERSVGKTSTCGSKFGLFLLELVQSCSYRQKDCYFCPPLGDRVVRVGKQKQDPFSPLARSSCENILPPCHFYANFGLDGNIFATTRK